MKKFKNIDVSKYGNDGKRLPEHETLLSFNSDGGNYAFNEWWHIEGSKLFNEWCLNSDEYRCEAID